MGILEAILKTLGALALMVVFGLAFLGVCFLILAYQDWKRNKNKRPRR